MAFNPPLVKALGRGKHRGALRDIFELTGLTLKIRR